MYFLFADFKVNFKSEILGLLSKSAIPILDNVGVFVLNYRLLIVQPKSSVIP